jgi:signal transduction histidine kinase
MRRLSQRLARAVERFRFRVDFWSGRSLARRLIILAAAWIIPLLALGGFALDRVVTRAFTSNLDTRLQQYLTSLIAVAEIGPYGEVRLSRPMGDQGFLEIYSGLYYQIAATDQTPFRSRSLWDREIPVDLDVRLDAKRTTERALWPRMETLRIVEQDVKLPGAQARLRFLVAERVDVLAEQIAEFRRTLLRALIGLGLGLIILSGVQATYGLWPLRRVRRGLEAIRSGRTRRLEGGYPLEVQPLADEMNALLDHSDEAAEQARTHAGNLAHALKTPMAVLINEAQGDEAVDPALVSAQVALMKKHVEHHLARARALGRRAMIGARTPVMPSIDNLKRVLERLYDGYKGRRAAILVSGLRDAMFRGEKQDLEEIIGNLMDNACKYGGGRVQVTVSAQQDAAQKIIAIAVEDDGPGIAPGLRSILFRRGARLDESKTGTGLGLAIVRDVAEIYGGSIALGDSESLGGLKVTLLLPAAE